MVILTLVVDRITAQLVPHNIRRTPAPITVNEVYAEKHYVSFRWDDLLAIAPWMVEHLQRKDELMV